MFQPLGVQLSYEHPPASPPPPLPWFPPRCTVREKKGDAGTGRVCVCAPSLSQGVSALAFYRHSYLTLLRKMEFTMKKIKQMKQTNKCEVKSV